MATLCHVFLCFVVISSFLSQASSLYYRRIGRGKLSRPSGYSYNIEFILQKIDHFSYTTDKTFQQRYLINTDHWTEGSPIFFYCGNEGDIDWFCNNTGFMWDIAPEYNAMLVFAEHRYYGNSLPFGEDSYKDLEHLGYLSSEQALADFDVLIKALKIKYGNVPVVAFGGSYGGMLAAWMRMKYPSAVIGSIAASAPVWLFPGLTDCEGSYHIISNTVKEYSSECYNNIMQSWSAIDHISSSTDGLNWLSSTFHLCRPLEDNGVTLLTDWLEEVWFNLAETNYPYPTEFLEPLPAWPLKMVCQYLAQTFTNHTELVRSLSSAVQVYYNYSGQSSCLDLNKDSSDDMGDKVWSFQSCTEMVMPQCSNGAPDIFPIQPWNITDYIENCQKTYFGIKPQPYWIEDQYNGKNLSGISNIVFSNGDLDPWSAGGVLVSQSDSLIAVVIKDGAHHLDLRATNENDVPSVKNARAIHRQNIDKWLSMYGRTFYN